MNFIETFCNRCNKRYFMTDESKTCHWCEGEDRDLKLTAALVVIVVMVIGGALWWLG